MSRDLDRWVLLNLVAVLAISWGIRIAVTSVFVSHELSMDLVTSGAFVSALGFGLAATASVVDEEFGTAVSQAVAGSAFAVVYFVPSETLSVVAALLATALLIQYESDWLYPLLEAVLSPLPAESKFDPRYWW